MSTSATVPATSPQHHAPQPSHRPRVWLVAGGHTPDPCTCCQPAVRDTLMHTWRPGNDGLMHMTTANGHNHHARWAELRARYDLVEVA